MEVTSTVCGIFESLMKIALLSGMNRDRKAMKVTNSLLLEFNFLENLNHLSACFEDFQEEKGGKGWFH